MNGKSYKENPENFLKSSNTYDPLRRRGRQKTEELRSQQVPNRIEIISQDERNTIIYNMCLIAISLILLGAIWYLYNNSKTTITTITVNYDKRYTSSIYSMCIFSDSLLIAVDNANKSIKAINTETQKLDTTFYTESDPWTVTKVTDSKIAISLANAQKIQLISVIRKQESDKILLTINDNITVNGNPIGIQYWNEKLYVVIANSAIKSGVYILNMDGTVIQSITKDSMGNQLFFFPLFIALNTQTDTMYISDIVSNSITSLSFDGEVRSIYKDDDILQMPGITVDALGRVYLCRQNSDADIFEENPHDILRLSEDLRMKRIVLAKKQDINFPLSVVYDDKNKRLYVGSKNSNVIQFFNVL